MHIAAACAHLSRMETAMGRLVHLHSEGTKMHIMKLLSMLEMFVASVPTFGYKLEAAKPPVAPH